MATGYLDTPHPLLAACSLYIADVPQHVKWPQLTQAFKPCGFVKSGGKRTGVDGRTRWTVIFSDIFHAEMALATLQGAIVPGVTPPFCLALSHSPSLEECLPEDRLFHQFVKCTTNTRHVLYDSSAQDVFSWFRSAGPLVSVRVNVNVGHAYATCVLEYWEDTHAQYARTHCRMMHPALAAMDHFSLRTYNPCTIFCTKFPLAWTRSTLHETFGLYGQIVNLQIMKTGTPAAFGFITYATDSEAAAALEAKSGVRIGDRTLVVRYHEPVHQDVFRMPATDTQGSQRQHSQPDPNSQRERRHTASAAGEAEDPGTAAGPSPTQESPPNARPGDGHAPQPNAGHPTANASAAEHNNHEDVEAARLKREAAVEAERQAHAEQEAAEAAERTAQADLQRAADAYAAAKTTQSEADEAVLLAEEILREAKERQLHAVHEVVRGLEEKNAAALREQDASRRRHAAVQEAVQRRLAAEEARRAEAEVLEKASAPPMEEPKPTASPVDEEPEWRAEARKRREGKRRADDTDTGAWQSFNWRGGSQNTQNNTQNGARRGSQETRGGSQWRDEDCIREEQLRQEEEARLEAEEELRRQEEEEAIRQAEEEEEARRNEEDAWREAEEERQREEEQIRREQEEARRQEEEQIREEQEAARMEEERKKKEEEKLRDDERKREEQERQEVLRESIRRMRIIQEQEAADRRERERKIRLEKEMEDQRRQEAERLAREERERQDREDAERKAAEECTHQEEQARRERVYRDACGRERARCRRRDARYGIPADSYTYFIWTKEKSIRRFQEISTDFDETRFCESQPLIFESIPWPLLRSPPDLAVEHIDWSAVEEFFAAAKLLLGYAEYKSMLEKSHRRFHPDKWKSRGILSTVLDEQSRVELETAGNVVAQAITPLWLASKTNR